MKSMCHDARRNSPSVADWRPISSCFATMRRIASSSIARSSSASIFPAAASSRACRSSGGRRRLPTWSARNGGVVRRPVRVAVAVSECISGTSSFARAEAISPRYGARPWPREWWRKAVVYQIYVRSFADSDGDGVGDLNGIRSRLAYLSELGVDGFWLTPFYPSPGADHGYDVADYTDVDPQFGTLADFDALVEEAHALGLRVLVDIVPNHTSREHPWFRNALSSADHPDRARYVFRPGRDGGPPNGWTSVFGGSAWTLDEPSGEWYLHFFSPDQPDLDWHNEQVQADFEDILRFWLDRGVDGFRIDVAQALFKARDLHEMVEPDPPTWHADWVTAVNQPELHPLYQRWRTVADEYPASGCSSARSCSRIT